VGHEPGRDPAVGPAVVLFGHPESPRPTFDDAQPGDTDRIEWIQELITESYGSRLLLSHDVFLKRCLVKYGGDGYDYIPTTVLPALREYGVAQSDIETVVDCDFHMTEEEEDFLPYLEDPFDKLLNLDTEQPSVGKGLYANAGYLTPMKTGKQESPLVRTVEDVREAMKQLHLDKVFITPGTNLRLSYLHHDELAVKDDASTSSVDESTWVDNGDDDSVDSDLPDEDYSGVVDDANDTGVSKSEDGGTHGNKRLVGGDD